MAEPEAQVVHRRRLAPIWLVPIVALLLGLGMVVHTFRSQGPTIKIIFQTATGVEAEKTKIRTLAVQVGMVEAVYLDEDLNRVVVEARIDKAVAPLLREDTQFWVVRPRFGAGGVSGLGTALSGAYIQLAPGTQKAGRREFHGLEEPPVTPVGTPGLHVELTSDSASSASTGNPILYKGFRVGRIERAELDLETRKMHYSAFIEAPYDDLVSTTTRFWEASGVEIKAGAAGVEVDTGSLESLLVGGVAIGRPRGVQAGEPVENGAVFRLYDDYDEVNDRPYRTRIQYVGEFEQSVRGLQMGAPVEFRGLRVGHVERILLPELATMRLDQGAGAIPEGGSSIPVLMEFEPGLLTLPDNEIGAQRMRDAIEAGISAGMRATLATGNLLTGSLYVKFDYFPDAPDAEIGTFANYPTIPTAPSGLEGIQAQAQALLSKLNELPLHETVDRTNQMLASLDTILANDELQAMPATIEGVLKELQTTLDSVSPDSPFQTRLLRTTTELERSLQSLRRLLDSLDENPNAILFNRSRGRDPEPPAGRP